MSDAELINLADYEALAVTRIEPSARDYYLSGAHDEITLRDNIDAYQRIRLRPRMLTGVGDRDHGTTVLGRHHDWPVLMAPTAFAKLAHPDGEIAMARAAAHAGVTQVLSTLSTTSLEDVAAVPDRGPLWFQLYVFRDRDVTRRLVERAEGAGYEALVVTVDAPLLGQRERDARNQFTLPPELGIGHFADEFARVVSDHGDSGLFEYFLSLIDPTLSWSDIDWLASITSLPVLVKGVLRADDAAIALDHGAVGVIVSNHGGRQLDTAIASIDALPEIADEIGGRAAVLVDGGVRRGTDILKALSLGADAVLLGRPGLWGLAVDGEAGVHHMLELLRTEFDLAMALCGARSVGELTPDLIA